MEGLIPDTLRNPTWSGPVQWVSLRLLTEQHLLKTEHRGHA